MKPEEAIKEMDKICENCRDAQIDFCYDCDGCFYPIAKRALEKQIIEVPDGLYNGYADGHPVIDYICPMCGNLIDDTDHYCCNCGQKIGFKR